MVANTDIDIDSLLRRIDYLEQLVSNHIGPQSAAINNNLPHPNISAIGQGARTITNDSSNRTLNVSTVTLTQLANNVATLYKDLQLLGIIG